MKIYLLIRNIVILVVIFSGIAVLATALRDVTEVKGIAVTEDSPAWDGLHQGNCVARTDEGLLFNLDCLTGDPGQDCETLLGLWELGGRDRAGFATPELCEPVRVNR